MTCCPAAPFGDFGRGWTSWGIWMRHAVSGKLSAAGADLWPSRSLLGRHIIIRVERARPGCMCNCADTRRIGESRVPLPKSCRAGSTPVKHRIRPALRQQRSTPTLPKRMRVAAAQGLPALRAARQSGHKRSQSPSGSAPGGRAQKPCKKQLTVQMRFSVCPVPIKPRQRYPIQNLQNLGRAQLAGYWRSRFSKMAIQYSQATQPGLLHSAPALSRANTSGCHFPPGGFPALRAARSRGISAVSARPVPRPAAGRQTLPVNAAP